jgi:hypothetical protein
VANASAYSSFRGYASATSSFKTFVYLESAEGFDFKPAVFTVITR